MTHWEKTSLYRALGTLSALPVRALSHLPLKAGRLRYGLSFSQWFLLLGMGAGLLYSVLIIATKNVRHMSGLNCAAYELFIAFIVIVIYLLASGVPLPVIPTAADLSYVLIIGFVNTGLAYYLYFSSLQALPAQTSALVSYLEPLTALIVSALFLGEKLGGVQMLGAVLILGGAFVGELRAEK